MERRSWPAALLIVAAATVAYCTTLRAPFVFDDLAAIVDNATIRQLWPLSTPLSPPPGGLPVSGRPLVNLTFALNHAIGGLKVWSYHALNVVLHALAALTLFGVVRRTLQRPACNERVRTAAAPLALAIALLWVLHPLQTAAVTYVAQRTEVLASLCYLLTLLAFIRAAENPATSTRWSVFAVASCLLGMASKEIMASAPLVVLLYDRTFFAGSFRAARRRRVHLALAATWGLLAWLVLGTAKRGGTAGFGLNITPLEYALTQAQAITRYLGLVVWPHPLVFDYGDYVARDLLAIAPFVVLIALLLGGVGWALARRPVWGFAGAMFFAVLAPSSSVVPVATQTMAEHRMYLPLALVLALVGVGLCQWLGRRAVWVLAAAAVLCGALTVRRNADFQSARRLWQDTVDKRPTNVRAHNNLAAVLLEDGRRTEAISELEEALRLDPHFPDALRNFSQALLQSDRIPEALARAEEAVRIDGGSAASHNIHGSVLLRLDRIDEAVAAYREAVRLAPSLASAHNNLGDALRRAGQHEAARTELATALRLNPDLAEAHYNLGQVLLATGQLAPAMVEFETALRLKPDTSPAHQALAGALLQLGRTAEAIAHGREAVRLTPDSFDAHYNFGTDLAGIGRFNEAIAELREACRLRPESTAAHYNLANTLLRDGQLAEAITEYQESARLAPGLADVQFNLGNALMQAGRAAEALPCFQAVLRLEPPSPAILCALGYALAETGRTPEAVAAFREALRIDPAYAPAQEALKMLPATGR